MYKDSNVIKFVFFVVFFSVLNGELDFVCEICTTLF